MTRQAFTKIKLPDEPGVYFFLGRNKKPLYIGRATSLRHRVQSYFAADIAEKRSTWIEKMLGEAKSVEYKKTASVLEAILLEANLIRQFKPPYNTKEKDDKSYNCIAITDEEFPRVLVVRDNTLHGKRNFVRFTHPSERAGSDAIQNFSFRSVFGPFPDARQLRTAFKIVRKIFPYRDTCSPPLKGGRGDVRPCFNRQIGLCPGVCTGEISAKEYRKHLKRLEIFLSGNTAGVAKALEREMKTAARRQEFERAGELRRQLFALRHIQDVALIDISQTSKLPNFQTKSRIESYDLSHFGGKDIVGAMAVVEDGAACPSEYRLFKIRGTKTQNEVAGLQEILTRRLAHAEWPLPQLVVVDGNAVQKRAAERILATHGLSIPVVAVVKDERHRPREIIGSVAYGSAEERAVLLANVEAHRFALQFQKKRRYNKTQWKT